MVQALFLWFYCLPIPTAVLLIIVVSIAYLILRHWLREMRLWRHVIALLFLAWILVLIVATLSDRTSTTIPVKPYLMPFHSYWAVHMGETKELLRSNLMNVILFYPAGLLGCELLPNRWSLMRKAAFVFLLSALIGAGIELCQYCFALGQAEVDDVIHNALGALIGALISTIPVKWKPGKLKK